VRFPCTPATPRVERAPAASRRAARVPDQVPSTSDTPLLDARLSAVVSENEIPCDDSAVPVRAGSLGMGNANVLVPLTIGVPPNTPMSRCVYPKHPAMPTKVRSTPGLTTAVPNPNRPTGDTAGTLLSSSAKLALPSCGKPLGASARPSQPTP